MAALRFLIPFFLLLTLSLLGYAQVPDSIRTPRDISSDRFNMNDTTNLPEKENREVRKEEKQPEIYKDSARLAVEGVTRTAATRSAILPGWGQLFNGGWGYVKAPIIWAGFGGLGYSFVFAQRNYRETLDEVQHRVQNQDIPENPKYEGADTQWLIGAKDFYRRNRDLTVLLTLGWYALNIIDAYIDAKFVRYDMSDDLTFKITPTLMQVPNAYAFSSMPVVGLKATFALK